MRTYRKTILRDIKLSFSRFIAIIAIVALGVGVLVGLLSTSPDLISSMDSFYDMHEFHDINLKSNIGFSEQSIPQIEAIYSEEGLVEGIYEVDEMVSLSGKNTVGRIIKREVQNTKVDKLELVDGRFAKEKNECVVERNNKVLLESSIGDKVIIGEAEYIVVGHVKNPCYISKEKEPSLIGNGRLGVIVYLDEKPEIITDIIISIQSLKRLNSFSTKYINQVNKKVDELDKFIENTLAKRKNDIYDSTYEVVYQSMYDAVYLEIYNQIKATGVEDSTAQFMTLQQMNLQLEKIREESKKQVESSLDSAQIYPLTRESNPSYANYKIKSKMVEKVAGIFPIFFFLVASLISLTTITRMVEEDRSSIGTLKALGYSKKTILSKYVIYVLLACGIGSIVGVTLGIFVLPYIIYNSYLSLYFIDNFKVLFNWFYIGLSTIAMILVILLVTIYVCMKTLKERPSTLLLGKAPKAGKRIILERIGFIWKRLKFKYKSSIRNVFRYKKNFFVMLLGVGGCSALLLCALALKDSINISETQYEKIFNYDAIISLADEDLSFIENNKEITSGIPIYQSTATTQTKEELNCSLIYASSDINNYINFFEKKKSFDLNSNSVIVSAQIAEKNKLKVGNDIELELKDKTTVKYPITNICENYIDNFVYIGTDSLDKYNAYLAKLDLSTSVEEDEFMTKLLSLDNITAVTLNSQMKETFSSVVSTLNYVVAIVVLCSGALAIIVIYNLTNINISERIREIATLKVLGYHPREVAGYIYRETIIMTILGSAIGLGLGGVLLSAVLSIISSPGMLFKSVIHWYTYLIGFSLTILFSVLVDVLFIRKIRKIKMVESLKSVD